MIALGMALSFLGIVAVLVRPTATSVLLGAQMICTVWSFLFASLPSHERASIHPNHFLIFTSMSLFLIFSASFSAFLLKWTSPEKEQASHD